MAKQKTEVEVVCSLHKHWFRVAKEFECASETSKQIFDSFKLQVEAALPFCVQLTS